MVKLLAIIGGGLAAVTLFGGLGGTGALPPSNTAPVTVNVTKRFVRRRKRTGRPTAPPVPPNDPPVDPPADPNPPTGE